MLWASTFLHAYPLQMAFTVITKTTLLRSSGISETPSTPGASAVFSSGGSTHDPFTLTTNTTLGLSLLFPVY